MEMENWLLSALVLIIFLMSLCFLFHKKRGINREKEEKVGESSNQEQVSGDPPEEFEHEMLLSFRFEEEKVGESSNQEQVSGDPPVFEYEVFLSFCGEDIRYTFADHLYRHLTDVRIQTFRDNEKLHVGEEIGSSLLKAIKESKIMIPIFSKGYASSKWCLMELTHMVKCVEGNKERAMIWPVFYDVTPSEVRNQTGSFEEAFVRHTKDFDKATVDEWKEALKTVAYLTGLEKDKIAKGYESNLVKEVVSKVLMKLKKMHVEVSEHLVGMDQHRAELMQLLNLGCNDVKIVGIVGMGGIGKTTIAKFIYNELCEKKFHQRCSFLEVREEVKRSGHYDDLKKQLMEDILKRTSDRMQMNQSTFKSTKALIVLDDVDDSSQLKKIIRKPGWFGPGSRIIVTTRNRGTFKEQEGVKVYELGKMNSKNALRLFCKHAFRQDCPLQDYETVSKEVVSKVAGLPLSLEVIGSLLSTKEREVWEVTLKKLEKIMPEKVQERLQISYDMLDDGQKEIFLDIACHFIYSYGEERRAASYMWEDYGFFPDCDIEALVTLSLVKIDKYGRFTMHDQLRDLGREIVRKQGPRNPGNRSRLWSNEVAREVLTSKRGTERVETLTLDFFWQDPLSNEDFKGLYRLRYLDLSRTSNLKGDFKDLLSELRWFRWWYSQSQITEITNFCLPKLVVLDLSRSDISDGWEDRIQIKEATNLKVLDLSHCTKLTKIPDLTAFSKLEELNLEQCTSLVEISPSIGHLQHLKYLTLNTSSESKWELPESIWNLKSLVELHMRDLGVTELSKDIGNLTNLTILDVGKTDIKKLPDEFGKLKKLKKLDASGCKSLEELPETIKDLRSLRLLVIKKSGVKKLPNAIGLLEELEELDAEDCTFLGELPKHIGKLTNLRGLGIGNSMVKELPSEIGKLEKLEWLDVTDCKLLRELPDSIVHLTNLRSLCIRRSRVKRLPWEIKLLKKLEELDASDCKLLGELPESIGKLRNLRILRVSSSGIKKLPAGIKRLKKLEELDCSCSSLEGELPSGVWSLSALTELNLYNTKISSLLPADISRCSHLTTLDLGSCPGLRLPSSGLKLPPGLEAVEIPLTKASLDSVVRLPELKRLAFHLCDRTDLGEFPIDLGGLPHGLEVLRFYGFNHYPSVPVKINNLPWLRFLGIRSDNLEEWYQFDECELVLALDGCESPESGLVPLESPLLKLDGCKSLERLPDLPNALEVIRIRNCPKLSDIGSLSGLTSLVELDIENCPSLESLPALQWLEKLTISRCEKLRKILGIEALTSLESLKLVNCPSIEKLPHLSLLKTELEEIYLENCGTENESDESESES